MKQFKQRVGAQGQATGAINVSDTYYAGELAATTNQSVTIPTDGNICVFSANGDFYVRYDGSAATVPSGSIASGSADLSPAVRDVSDLTTLNIIAPATTKITLAFYS
jgi:predicted NUDIX family NTP pyrophosphohydrolase